MKCLLIFYVKFVLNDHPEEFGIEKEFEIPFKPSIGDEFTVCGDCSFKVQSVDYDVDFQSLEIRFDSGPSLESVQRWINHGFQRHDTGVEFPPELVW
jgi:hypothetical protein